MLSVYSQIFKDEDKKGACLREMPQESMEIFDFRPGSLAFKDSETHQKMMGVSHRRRHPLAVPPRSVIGSLSKAKIGSMESRLPSSAK